MRAPCLTGIEGFPVKAEVPSVRAQRMEDRKDGNNKDRALDAQDGAAAHYIVRRRNRQAGTEAGTEGEKCFYDRDKKFYASFGFLRKLNPVSWK